MEMPQFTTCAFQKATLLPKHYNLEKRRCELVFFFYYYKAFTGASWMEQTAIGSS